MATSEVTSCATQDTVKLPHFVKLHHICLMSQGEKSIAASSANESWQDGKFDNMAEFDNAQKCTPGRYTHAQLSVVMKEKLQRPSLCTCVTVPISPTEFGKIFYISSLPLRQNMKVKSRTKNFNVSAAVNTIIIGAVPMCCNFKLIFSSYSIENSLFEIVEFSFLFK